jgi:hypothetical protein
MHTTEAPSPAQHYKKSVDTVTDYSSVGQSPPKAGTGNAAAPTSALTSRPLSPRPPTAQRRGDPRVTLRGELLVRAPSAAGWSEHPPGLLPTIRREWWLGVQCSCPSFRTAMPPLLACGDTARGEEVPTRRGVLDDTADDSGATASGLPSAGAVLQ